MKIGMYAFDKGPADMFSVIAKRARELGYEPLHLPPLTQGVVQANMDKLEACDVILTAFSSTGNEENFGVYAAGKPVIALHDVPDAFRPNAIPFASRTKKLILAHPTDEEKARAQGFDPIYLGPPAHWGKSYHEMKNPVREKLFREYKGEYEGQGMRVPLYQGQVLIYCPGTKNPVLANTLLKGVREAGLTNYHPSNLVVGYKKHPGEQPKKDDSADQKRYQKLWKEREETLRGLWLLDCENYTNPQLYAAADLVVCTGGPTETISGAFARLRMIYLWDKEAQETLRKSGTEDGTWFVANLKGVHMIEDAAELPDAIRYLASAEGTRKLREQQEASFPIPNDWDTATKIINFVTSL